MATKTINAELLTKMFLSGAANLEAKKEFINELNVFPVPDGDTGTNMTLTIMSAAKEVSALEQPDMLSVSKAISSGSLRECLVHYIINQESENGTVTIDMTREEFADYLNVTRPSLSRELMNMQRDGLITVSGRNIQVASQELLEDYL